MGRYKLNSDSSFLAKDDKEKEAIIRSTLRLMTELYNKDKSLLLHMEKELLMRELKIKDLQNLLETKQFDKFIEY